MTELKCSYIISSENYITSRIPQCLINKNIYIKSLSKLDIFHWVEIITNDYIYYTQVCPYTNISETTIVEPVIKKSSHSEVEKGKCIIRRLESSTTAKEIDIILNFNEDTNYLEMFGENFENLSKSLRQMIIRNLIKNFIILENCIIEFDGMSIEINKILPKKSNNTSQVYIMSPHTNVNIIKINTDTNNKKEEKEKETNNEKNIIDQLTLKMNQLTINNYSVKSNIKVSPLAGLENAYQSLLDIIMYPLIYPDFIKKLNIECPKGILLYGPPGVGKTTLVKTLAENTNANMLTINGPEVYGPYIGDSEEKLRQIFEDAHMLINQSEKPCILFIDEIDALAPLRENTHNHESRVVAQLLTLMDGMKQRGRLIIIGATNRPNAIDPALRRPGRFDREVAIDVPNEEARYRIIKEQTKSMPIDDSVDYKQLALTTNGYVGSDLCNLCREAAFCAFNNMIITNSNPKITMADFKKALTYVEPSLKREQSLNIERLTWNDVGGLEDVKKKIRQAVEWPLLYKDVYQHLGLNPAKGILLYGPPGCSKTTLVKIIANTSHASFFMISCASLYSSFVGDSEKLVRNVFQKARASSPSVIFIDEVDAIVGRRGIGSNGTSDSVQERILSMLLNELDGIEAISSVLIVGATNRPDLIDAALLRSGRFDQIIYVPPPDYEGRRKIFDIYTKNMPIADNVDFEELSNKTELYTGADIQNLCREAAIIALRKLQNVEYVEMDDFMAALKIVKPSLSLEMENQYKSLVEKYGSGTQS